MLLLLTSRRNEIYLSEIVFLQDAVAKSPGKQRPHFNYGCALARAQLYEQALDQFALCLTLPAGYNFQEKDLYIEMGNAHFFLANYDEAAAKWRHALTISPGDPEISNNMAMAMIKQGRLDDALRWAETARECASTKLLPDVLLTIAEINFLKKNMNIAEELVRQALQDAPQRPLIYYSAAMMYDDIGMAKKAAYYANMYLQYEHDDVRRLNAVLPVNKHSNKKLP